jgi:hypothetical protein
MKAEREETIWNSTKHKEFEEDLKQYYKEEAR